jgi:hypothetical protein
VIVEALLEKETLTGDEFRAMLSKYTAIPGALGWGVWGGGGGSSCGEQQSLVVRVLQGLGGATVCLPHTPSGC